MNTSRLCPVCGSLLPSDAPRGLCPKCLSSVALGEVPTGKSKSQIDSPPFRYFGDYELLGEIAEGGMGVVYYARQISLRRPVALKMIRSGELALPQEVQRFRTEAEAAANLDHPNIVPIYEIGENGGQQYFTMKLMEGGNLGDLIAECGPRNVAWMRRTARLLATVARAVHHAHQRGVLHRDLKPTNILLDGNGEPHLTDFGLAKLMGRDRGLTPTEQVMGTPHYMAPEQAAGKARHLTTAADIYSLGAILYEMLTGRHLFGEGTPLEILSQVKEREPEPLRELNPLVDQDLETICLKCLAKEPEKRFSSAQQLAEELERFVNCEPIRARPLGIRDRASRWIRRRPALAALSAAALVLVLMVALGSPLAAWRKNRLLERAELRGYNSDMALAWQLQAAGDSSRAIELLDRYRPGSEIRIGKSADLRGWEWRYLWALTRGSNAFGQGGPTNPMALPELIADVFLSPNGGFLGARQAGTLIVWELPSLRLASRWNGGEQLKYHGVALFGDGNRAAAGYEDGSIQIVNTSDGKLLNSWKGHASVRSLNISSDGALMASVGDDQQLRVWNVGKQRELWAASVPGDVKALTIAANNQVLGWAHDSRVVELRKLQTGQSLGRFESPDPGVSALAISSDGRTLAIGGVNGTATVWLVARPNQSTVALRGHIGGVHDLVFSPDNRRLAVLSGNGEVKLWELETQQELIGLRGSVSGRSSFMFHGDGNTLVLATTREVYCWRAPAFSEIEAAERLSVGRGSEP